MIGAKDAVVWVNHDTKEVMVKSHAWGTTAYGFDRTRGAWGDPIGAAYSQWDAMNNEQRMRLMCETVIDLGMQGIPLKRIVTAFAEVKEFHALGRESYPMCRALTSALLGKCLEPNTMVFEELLAHYSWSRANDYRATANHRPAARQQRQ